MGMQSILPCSLSTLFNKRPTHYVYLIPTLFNKRPTHYVYLIPVAAHQISHHTQKHFTI